LIVINENRGRLAILIEAVLLVWVFASCAPHNSGSQTSALRKVRFDRDEWIKCTPTSDGRTVRSQMADDLVRNHQLSSLNKEQIIELLGKPIVTKHADPQWDIMYWIGPERGVTPLDDEYLVFKFDSTGKVVDFCVTTMK
jgi:hypothetical protein